IISKLQSSAQSRDVYFDERFSTSFRRPNPEHWEKLFSQSVNFTPLRFENTDSSPDPNPESPVDEVLFQIHSRYIVRPVKSGLMFLDQQYAHERILYEKFLDQLKNKSGQSQQDLFPQAVTL